MANDIISKKTRYEFREYMTSWVLRTIESEFDAADIERDDSHKPHESGQRRCLIEQYYKSLDFTSWADSRKLLKVYESVLVRLDEEVISISLMGVDPNQWAVKTRAALVKWLERDGFYVEDGRILRRGATAGLPAMEKAAGAFDVPELQRQIMRLQSAIEDDPGLAVGTAKELVETTCKTVLHARGVKFSDTADVGELVKATRAALELLPHDIPQAAKGADVIRRLLSNLGAVGQSLAELRNLYGTGHGRHGQSKGLTSRHARLAVGSATTLATFLLETHEARSTSKP